MVLKGEKIPFRKHWSGNLCWNNGDYGTSYSTGLLRRLFPDWSNLQPWHISIRKFCQVGLNFTPHQNWKILFILRSKTSKNYLIRNFLRNGRVTIRPRLNILILRRLSINHFLFLAYDSGFAKICFFVVMNDYFLQTYEKGSHTHKFNSSQICSN